MFFHPIGLALEVIMDDETGEESLGGVWDYRDDDEGMFFGPDAILKIRIDYVEALRKSKIKHRKENEYIDVEVDEEGVQIH